VPDGSTPGRTLDPEQADLGLLRSARAWRGHAISTKCLDLIEIGCVLFAGNVVGSIRTKLRGVIQHEGCHGTQERGGSFPLCDFPAEAKEHRETARQQDQRRGFRHCRSSVSEGDVIDQLPSRHRAHRAHNVNATDEVTRGDNPKEVWSNRCR